MIEEKKLTEKVSVELNETQLLEIGREESEAIKLYEKIEAETPDRVAAYRDLLKKLWTRISELAGQRMQKKRVEEVEVKEIFDLTRNTVCIVRADDERQVVRTRPMTLSEMAEYRQTKIPLDTKARGPSSGDSQNVVKLDKGRGRAKKSDVPEKDPEGSV